MTNYSDKLKDVTEYILKLVSEDLEINVEDKKYLNGYYIFEFGDNSVVHFKFKETPGWLYGIWWNVPEDNEQNKDEVEGTFFAQYEETINKFKPSCSKFCIEFKFNIEDNCSYELDDIRNDIKFIKDEPYLAFCRDYCGWNYNLEYHTRTEAKGKFIKYQEWKKTRDLQTKVCDERVIKFITEKVLPLFVGAEIHDCGEDISPRYDVVAPLEYNKGFEEKGCYDLFDETKPNERKLLKEYNKIVKECTKVGDKFKFSWFPPIDPFVIITDKSSEETIDE